MVWSRIRKVLKEYALKAAFHLNSGLYGDKTYERRIRNLGMNEMPDGCYHGDS